MSTSNDAALEKRVSDDINYDVKTLTSAQLSYRRLRQESGSTSLTISTTTQESVFLIPMDPSSSLYHSELSLTATPTAGGTTYLYNWLELDCLAPIYSLEFYSADGQMLCQLFDADIYTHAVWGPETKAVELQEFPDISTGSIAASLISDVDGSAYYYPHAGATTTTRVIGEIRPTIVGASNNATPVLNLVIPLRLVYNTIFHMKKLLWFGKPMYMRIVWNETAKWGFKVGSATVPTGGTGHAVSALGDIAITNLYLHQATCQDPEINSIVVGKVNSGKMKMILPWVWRFKQPFAAATSFSMQVRLGRQHGITCKRVYSLARYGAYANQKHCHDATSDASIQEFNTFLDTEPEHVLTQDTSLGVDYRELKEKLAGSCVSDPKVFYKRHVVISDYTGNDRLYQNHDNVLQGISLGNGERVYQLDASLVASQAYDAYMFFICQRNLEIHPGGVIVVA